MMLINSRYFTHLVSFLINLISKKHFMRDCAGVMTIIADSGPRILRLFHVNKMVNLVRRSNYICATQVS